MREINFASLNVNGAREFKKRAQVFELMKYKKFDVFFVQETHTDVSNAIDWVKEFDGLVILSHHTSLSGGVAVLFSKDFTPYSFSVEEKIKGRLLKIKIVFENSYFVFVCVYTPTMALERMIFLNTLEEALNECNNDEFTVRRGF